MPKIQPLFHFHTFLYDATAVVKDCRGVNIYYFGIVLGKHHLSTTLN